MSHDSYVSRDLVAGRRVTEVGAGLGVCGLMAGLLAKEVCITDANAMVVERIAGNIRLNLNPGLCSETALDAQRRPLRSTQPRTQISAYLNLFSSHS
jgi:predicted nicotinamide N-methyase